MSKSNKSYITSWSDYKLDPRFLIILFLGLFIISGQTYLNFEQGLENVIVAIATTVITEMILGRIILKKWVKPISALITGMGLSLLISSTLLWPYFLAGFLSIGMKYTFKYKGGHIFNPNNLAVVLIITFFPLFATITPKQWSNGYIMMSIIIALGLIVVVVAKRAEVAITFILFFLIIGYFRHLFFDIPLLAAIGPIMGASTQLFIFFMITDPKTTPVTRTGKILFALTITIIDGILRVNRIPHAPFYALFLTSIIFMIPYRYFVSKLNQKEGENYEGSKYKWI
ncbi:RnfABCDGE type electron transport complex subunit D [Virgibacillus sp.]|uniref:RnfABCDGE type electron transport complex subunit D n=1 Tax=Virgibacillus sp. TaxID=1872700 RepID=UPI00181C6B56|nr:RnfABCDGE type electron transport complex subunit D [Virgibacillus sp.]NWO15085.1 RnfABCDGE type electron transport complex subunit D [Virgibacillus sp.]